MVSYFPGLGQIGSDEFNLDLKAWQGLIDEAERNAYVWNATVFAPNITPSDWESSFNAIYTSNVVLQALDKIVPTADNAYLWNNLKGSALFYRAYRYFALSEVFTLPYDAETAGVTLGLPLRISPDVDYLAPRSTLSQTFDFIIGDLERAAALLEDSLPDQVHNRPSKAAAYGALAKVYLVMGNFDNALINAEKCLSIYDVLLDYNDLRLSVNYPFENNPEILFSALMAPYWSSFSNINPSAVLHKIDSALLSLYPDDDLRKAAFFMETIDSNYVRRHLYSFDGRRPECETGITTNEIYLIKAECQARLGQSAQAIQTLREFQSHRYLDNRYEEIQDADLLDKIITERRKELVFRGARWSDIRRLNIMGAGIEMKRVLDGKEYLLQPNSPRYALPIPDLEVNLSGLEQNER